MVSRLLCAVLCCHSRQAWAEHERDQQNRHLRANSVTQSRRALSSATLDVTLGRRQMSQRQIAPHLQGLPLRAPCVRAMRDASLPDKELPEPILVVDPRAPPGRKENAGPGALFAGYSLSAAPPDSFFIIQKCASCMMSGLYPLSLSFQSSRRAEEVGILFSSTVDL